MALHDLDIINRQLNFNNSVIDRLLSLLEENQRQNASLIRQIERTNRVGSTGVNSTRRGVTGTVGNTGVDVLFYFFPETVIPSRDIINAETSSHIFQTIISPKNMCCPITFEPFTSEQSVTMINQCEHLFTSSELDCWFQTHSTCPVCRYNICSREYENPVSEPPVNTPPSRSHRVFDIIGNIVSDVSRRPLNTVTDIFDTFMDEEIVENVVNRFRDSRNR